MQEEPSVAGVLAFRRLCHIVRYWDEVTGRWRFRAITIADAVKAWAAYVAGEEYSFGPEPPTDVNPELVRFVRWFIINFDGETAAYEEEARVLNTRAGLAELMLALAA